MSANWAGVWDTDFGLLTVHAQGGLVTGSYEPRHGTIRGTITGPTMEGNWTQPFAEPGGKPTGHFRVTLNSDGSAFTGHWWYGNRRTDWDGEWNGTRLGFGAT